MRCIPENLGSGTTRRVACYSPRDSLVIRLDSHAGFRWVVVTATLVVGAALSVRGQATFRATVDLIAVDVQVVNDKGVPILGLGPDRFEVSINGKKRTVVSADLLRFDEATLSAAGTPPAIPAISPVRFAESNPADGRVFVLAVDTMSFQALETAPVREAAHAFVDRLQPSDLVGFVSFPLGRTLDATGDRSALTMELDRLVGQADPPTMNTFKLLPHEIVDITSLPPEIEDPTGPKTPFPIQGRLVDEICKGLGAGCPRQVVRDARTLAVMEEGMVLRRLDGLRAVLRELRKSPRRKVIVLISEGLLASDRPGGRPDIEDMGRVIGEDAARANTTIYVLHVDRQRTSQSTASNNRRPRITDDAMRDSHIVARPLNDIAASSGGAIFTVVQGGGDFAFGQIVKETAAYYLLGVEPDAADRDGRPRTLKVKANTGQRGAVVRARSWVVVPAR